MSRLFRAEWTRVACKHARTMQLSKTLGSRTQLGGAANAEYPILVCLSQQSPSEASAVGGRAVSAKVHSSVAEEALWHQHLRAQWL